ncbi:MAG: zinc ribbon domain-containing protein, partial [Burkholderiales bacterium]|nr:zinc ribbon domain-containing protein [Burkholderiales bacterium]
SFHEAQQELLNQAAQGGLEGGLGSELGALLAVQGQAWQVLLSSLEGPDLAVLRRGWELLEATMPRMVEIAREMRQVLQKSRPAAPTGMACLRCGHANPPSVRYCGACSAVLPEVFQAPTEYTDILGGAASETGTRLSNMERLLTAYEVGQVEGEEVLAELVALEQMSEQVLRTLEQDEPRIQTDQEADFARRFRELGNDDAQGLALLRKGLEEGDLSAAWQGLEVCRVAAQGVIGLKQEIDAVMNSEAG